MFLACVPLFLLLKKLVIKLNGKLLILSAKSETLENLSRIASGLSDELGFNGISVGSDSSALSRINSEGEYSMVIISAPLEDEYGISAALKAAEDINTSVIFTAAPKNLNAAYSGLKDKGIMLIPKPVSEPMLEQLMRFMVSEKKRAEEQRKTLEEMSAKLRDIKLIDRAKFTLIQYLRITEPEAHSQLRRRAMDMRLPMARAAEDILKTYEIM